MASEKPETIRDDAKVRIIPLREFLSDGDLFNDFQSHYCDKKPIPNNWYFSFTPKYLVRLNYGSINDGANHRIKPLLRQIIVAERDGKTEVEYFHDQLSDLEDPEWIAMGRFLLEKLPPFQAEPKPKKPSLEECLFVGAEEEHTRLAKNHVVLEIETNGPRIATDDVIAFSIFDPYSGLCYSRKLPLHKQPTVLTTYRTGITAQDLYDVAELDRAEAELIERIFHLFDRKIVTFEARQQDPFVHANAGFDFFFSWAFYADKIALKWSLLASPWGLDKWEIATKLGATYGPEPRGALEECLLTWDLFKRYMKNKKK